MTRHIEIALFVLAFALTAVAQDSTTPQLTQVPPKPSCNPDALFHTKACEDLWSAYNTAFKQREDQVSKINATAPLLREISEQQEQINQLRAELPEVRVAAHNDGVIQGTVYGVGGMLLMFAMAYGVRKLTRDFTVTKKSRAASA